MLLSLLYNFTPPGCRSCIKSSFLNVVFLMVSLIQWSHMVLQEIVCQIFRFIVINTLSPISNNDIFLYSDALISSSLLYLCMWSFVVAVFTASSSTECWGKNIAFHIRILLLQVTVFWSLDVKKCVCMTQEKPLMFVILIHYIHFLFSLLCLGFSWYYSLNC